MNNVDGELIYRGEFANDPIARTDEEINRLIIEQARRSGIDISDDDELEIIRGAGVSNYDGVSDTLIEPVMIIRKPKENDNVIYQGEYANDGLNKSDDEIKEDIINQAKAAGVEINNPSDVEVIRGAGVSDYDGISDTLIEPVTIVKKEQIVEREDKKEEKIRELQNEIERLKREREQFRRGDEFSKKNKEKLNNNKQKVEQKQNITTEVKEEKPKKKTKKEVYLEQIDALILDSKKTIAGYAKRYNELKKIVDEFTAEKYKVFDKEGLITLEELQELNKSSESIDKYLDEMILLKKQARYEKSKITALENKKELLLQDKTNKEILKLSDEEYREIVKTLKERKLLRSITEKEGLYEIYRKDVNERTPEEQARLVKVIKATFDEITKYKNSHRDLNVTEIIDILYNVEEKIEIKEEPKEIKLEPEKIEKVKETVNLLPVKVNFQPPMVSADNINYVPEPAPKDMQEVMQRGLNEKIQILIDEATDEKYINASNTKRFGIVNYGDKITFDGALYVKISDEDAKYVEENSSNDIDPYTVEVTDIIINQEEVEEEKEEVNIDVDTIINKIVDEVDVDYNEFTHYMASNINVSEKFKNELKSGKTMYNIVHIVPASIKAVVNSIKKLYGKFVTTEYATVELEKLKERVNNLSDDELKVLAKDYTEDKEVENEFINDIIIHKIDIYNGEQNKDYLDEMFDEYLVEEEENNKVR